MYISLYKREKNKGTTFSWIMSVMYIYNVVVLYIAFVLYATYLTCSLSHGVYLIKQVILNFNRLFIAGNKSMLIV